MIVSYTRERDQRDEDSSRDEVCSASKENQQRKVQINAQSGEQIRFARNHIKNQPNFNSNLKDG